MTKYYAAKIQTTDAKADKERRFRNILANSGEIMESGEIRDIKNLYVMDYDGKLIRIVDLSTDPEKQTEKYAVKAQADHGELIDGELIPSIEKQFGSCKVWLEDDGLHARMYFADNDRLADHAFAISEFASYSTGIDWFPDGYFGAGYEIEEPIGILREISMVLTGNDPRAKTIDTKKADSKGQGAAEAQGDKLTKGNKMPKQLDALTPDERAAMQREMGEAVDSIIDKFTTSAPESETEPTARDTKDDVEGGETTTVVEAKDGGADKKADKTTYHSNVVVIRDRAKVKQEKAVATKDWLTGEAGHAAFAKCLKQAGKLGATFDGLWRQEVSKHMSLDDISGLPTPTNIVSMFRDALEKSDGIIRHFEFVNSKGLKINLITAVAGQEDLARAHGHAKGDEKVDQALANTIREILCKMVYKRLPLDALELWENPNLIDFRSRELVDAIILEIERAAFIGDGRTAPATGQPDLRMYVNGRGFVSIKSDAAATSGFGTLVASTYTQAEGDNAYDTIVKARALIRKEGRQYIVAKNSWVATALTAKVGSNYLVQPGMKIEDVLGVERVYTPAWMDNDTNDAYLVVDKAYKMVGQNAINSHADFDTSTNENILLDETPRGGALGEYKSAVVIAPVPATPVTPQTETQSAKSSK